MFTLTKLDWIVPKFDSLDEFYAAVSADQAAAIKRFVAHVQKTHRELELVLAWNQPMFRIGTKYILGFMPTKNHINLLTVSDYPVTEVAHLLSGYRHGGRSIALAFDWAIDGALIDSVIDARKRELGLA